MRGGVGHTLFLGPTRVIGSFHRIQCHDPNLCSPNLLCFTPKEKSLPRHQFDEENY